MFLLEYGVIILDIDQRAIGYRYHTFTRVATHGTKSAHLFHVKILQPCQFEKHPVGCLVEIFIGGHKTTIERPFPSAGIQLSFADKQFELVFVEAENDAIDGHQHLVVLVIKRCHSVVSF